MSGTDAAATLSLKIDTHGARADLEALKKEYTSLHAAMREGLPKLGGSSSGLASAELNDAKAKYASLQKQLDATKSAFASLSQEFDGFKRKLMDPVGGKTGLFANVTKAGYELQGLLGQIDHKVELSSSALKIMLKSAEMTGNAIIKAAQVALSEQVRQGDQIVAAYARRNELIQALDLKRYEDAAAAEARLKSIQESRDKQTYDAEVAKYVRRNELIQALDLKRYEDAAAAEARLKSIQESRDKQTYDAEVAKYVRRNELIQALDLKRYEDAAAAEARLKSIQESRDKQTYDAEVAKYARRNELIQALDLKRYEDAAAAEARLKSIQESRDKQTYDAEVAKYARRNELIQALDLKRYEDAAAAEARLKSIQESRDKQTYDAEVAKYARRNELIQQLDVENYNARAASAARLKALQESRDKQMYDASVAAFEKQTALERKYILSSELSRVKAALDARKLIDGGYRGNLSAEFAPQTLLMASTNSAANLADKVKALGGAVAQNATHQAHWNTVANEGHAAARGLAGALGGLWLTYGSLAPLVATAALAGSLKGVFSVGKELEYEFTYIQAITNGVVVDLDKFGEAIKGSMATPVDAAKGLRTLAQAGLEVGEAITALPSVLKLATVGEVDLAGAALSATAIMHTFGMSVNDIGHIGDSLATAARLSATSVKEMMGAMKQATSVSNVFGVSLHETEAALATLANRGIEGSAAGTAIRNMVKELSSPATDKAAHALQQYGIQIFNADGSAKKFTANLQQLADVTSVMTKETKARLLEDMFNERGAKAANILLSDLEKMKTVLQEIEASSKGLGFMTEAQIRISQSTEGLIKTLKSNLAASLGEVFLEVKPQIDSVISSISALVSSSSFKKAISSMAEAVADFTLILRDHADKIATVLAAYAGFKVLGILGAGVLAFEGALASLSVVAASSSTLLAAVGGLLSGPVAIGLGVAAVAAGAYAIKQSGLDDTQKKVIQSARELTEAQGRLNQSLSDGLSALTKANDLQAERIRLLREGVSATDAAARANDNLGYSSAKANRDSLAADLAAAKNHLNSTQFDGQDINFNPSPQFEAAFDTVRVIEVEYKLAEQQLEESATKVIKAGMEGRRKELQDIQEKAYAEVEIQNKKFEAIERRASLAATELSEGKFYGKPETQEARKRTLQSDIDRGEAAKQFAPLDTRLAETEAVKVELARREAFLSENSLSYSRKESIAASKEANSLFKAQTDEIVKGYKARVDAENTEFNNYKQILDQRVKYGAISQGAENVLLEQAQSKVDARTSSLREAEKQELQTLLASKDATDAEKISMQTRIDEIDAIQKSSEAKRAHILVLNQEKDALKQLSHVRKLENDIAEFAGKEKLSRDKAVSMDTLRKTSNGETIAAVEAYYATLERGQTKLKEYEAAIRDAESMMQSLVVSKTDDIKVTKKQRDELQWSINTQEAVTKAIGDGVVVTRKQYDELQKSINIQEAFSAATRDTADSSLAQSDAMLKASESVEVATESYNKYKAALEEQAQANATLTESLKGPEESLKRMQAALSASFATMDATLNARSFSGFYTTLEGLRAEGNINKEKISQLAEMKAAYEAMGAAGAAAAQQIEAQMIELSAHLDPVADKIRGIFENAFTTFFEDVLNGTKSIKEAFKDLGKSILKEFVSIVAKEASQQLMKVLGGGLKPGESQGLFSFLGNLLVGNGADSVGTDIAATGRSVFDRLKNVGGGGSLGTTLQSIPMIDGGLTPKSMGGLQKSLDSLSSAANDSVMNLSSLSGAANLSVGSFSTLEAGMQTFGASSTLANTGLTSFAATTGVAETSMAATSLSTGLVDVSMGATAASAEAAALGLTSVATASTTESTTGFLSSLAGLFAANGYAFEAGGTKAFAAGGTFTNSIVNSPTAFRFSSGGSFKPGVMGEDGPEAIIPLARGKDGKLGIASQGSGQPINITVHVNGNSTAPDVRRSAAQGAREGLSVLNGARRYG
jgi:TP901 family phage tail tape measure protein